MSGMTRMVRQMYTYKKTANDATNDRAGQLTFRQPTRTRILAGLKRSAAGGLTS